MMLTFSVILTTYNSSSTIRRAINSIQSQQGNGIDFKIELIVVDDCSTDNTQSILHELGINFYSTSINSGGPNKGRNLGLQKVSGDWICISDHDDEWHSDRIQSILPYLSKSTIITSGYTLKDITTGNERVRCKKSSFNYIEYPENATFLSKLSRSGDGQQTYLGSILYNSKFKDILFEEEFGMVDFDWIVRLFRNNSSIEICDTLYTRWVDGANLSLNSTYRANDYKITIATLEKYKTTYPVEIERGLKKTHGSYGRYFYKMNRMKEARAKLLKAGFTSKNAMYFLSSFFTPVSNWVNRKFDVFG